MVEEKVDYSEDYGVEFGNFWEEFSHLVERKRSMEFKEVAIGYLSFKYPVSGSGLEHAIRELKESEQLNKDIAYFLKELNRIVVKFRPKFEASAGDADKLNGLVSTLTHWVNEKHRHDKSWQNFLDNEKKMRVFYRLVDDKELELIESDVKDPVVELSAFKAQLLADNEAELSKQMAAHDLKISFNLNPKFMSEVCLVKYSFNLQPIEISNLVQVA